MLSLGVILTVLLGVWSNKAAKRQHTKILIKMENSSWNLITFSIQNILNSLIFLKIMVIGNYTINPLLKISSIIF